MWILGVPYNDSKSRRNMATETYRNWFSLKRLDSAVIPVLPICTTWHFNSKFVYISVIKYVFHTALSLCFHLLAILLQWIYHSLVNSWIPWLKGFLLTPLGGPSALEPPPWHSNGPSVATMAPWDTRRRNVAGCRCRKWCKSWVMLGWHSLHFPLFRRWDILNCWKKGGSARSWNVSD